MKINAKMEPDPRSDRSSEKNSSYDYNLEGIRGLAALSVAGLHVLSMKNFLDPTYHPNIYFGYLQAGRSAVLLFFVLSGYVIGLTTTKEFSIQHFRNYISRRAIRILPIYFIAICFAVLAEPKEKLNIVLGNLLFLQNFDKYFDFSLEPIAGNAAVWSLNYEILYYLVFILVWWWRPQILTLFLSALLISVIGWFIPLFPQFISAYATGWIFWLSGLLLACKVQASSERESFLPLISYILLFHATNHFSTGKWILNALGVPNPVASFVNFSELTTLPICILIICEITRRYFYGFNYLRLLCFLIPSFHLSAIVWQGGVLQEPKLVAASLYAILAILLVKYDTSVNILKKMSFMGSISYAFYLLHMPIEILMHKYFPWQGTVLSFLLGLLIWLVITISLSSFLELVIQPRIKYYLSTCLLLEMIENRSMAFDTASIKLEEGGKSN
ncbi:acyltransferase family protein [Microseira wollei]|uniref:Acyltransferase n=1 Tax=Microseira wollei NIES-4236 TaxID=2530354 RepID=A0AAV3XH39_9CYAN|nr:acyltransferase [Microseira wollei]GET41598.1 putative acyltransferase [Microseira wollei NIES-4236]